MSEPGKAADPVPKAADDFVTKYKVRHLTLGDTSPPRRRRCGKITDFFIEPFGSFRAIIVL